MNTNLATYATELERIRLDHGGILNPGRVVDAARDTNSPIHACFEWDDSKAGHEYRLWQARHLISMVVTVLPSERKTIRLYVSLKGDREADGGYRHVFEVLNDKALKRAMLREAFEELEVFRQKYVRLQELGPIWRAMKRIKNKAKSTGSGARVSAAG